MKDEDKRRPAGPKTTIPEMPSGTARITPIENRSIQINFDSIGNNRNINNDNSNYYNNNSKT